jgi:2-oxoglutarate dehydrogenase E2 component (dihydrolipoamide succinyltransferase)
MALIEVKIPPAGESVTEATLSQWFKKNGDMVSRDETLCELETDKATQELPAEFAGKLIILIEAGNDVQIGEVIAHIDTDAAPSSSPVVAAPKEVPAPKKEEVKTPPPVAAAQNTSNYATGHPSPAASKILSEKNIAPSEISGTGKDGRITKDDAQKAVEKPAAAPTPSAAVSKSTPPSGGNRDVRREKMSRMRRTIASRLVSAKNTTAMLTTFNEVDLTAIMALRDKYQDGFVAKYGVKLGFMSLFVKACAKVLMEMPEVNAKIEGDELIYHNYADISVAISTPKGLVVPPVHNCESMNFAQIELAIKALAEKARSGKLTTDEMSGGTFTITNGGVFGSMMSTPIINEPQSAILGMHAIQQRAMVVDGEIKIRPMMYLALSYDHRVIDGSSSVTFLVRVKKYLEDPTTLLLDL